MKTLFLECAMGAAGDMISAALFELLPDKEGALSKLRSAGIPGVEFNVEKKEKCGITGTYFSVLVHGKEEDDAFSEDHDHGTEEHHHEHTNRSFSDIRTAVGALSGIPDNVKENVLSVYSLIAKAEGHVHGKPADQIHFHEVGELDAIADITASCLFMEELSPERVIVSPVRTGYGSVKCAHGILPVPAPATAYILKDVPIYAGNIEGEMCTPTGAALLKHFACEFGQMPVMKVKAIGYGMGKRDFKAASCVRAFLGETEDEEGLISELSFNVDDMTGEEISFAADRLFEGGAHEVYTIAVGMKKSRPGTLIKVICDPENRENMIRLIFKHTSTIGLRETLTKPYKMERAVKSVKTSLGEVRLKESKGYGSVRRKYEFDDISAIARSKAMSVREVKAAIDQEEQNL